MSKRCFSTYLVIVLFSMAFFPAALHAQQQNTAPTVPNIEIKEERSFLDTIQILLGLKEPDRTPRPEETLVAPFAEEYIKPIERSKQKNAEYELPINEIPLHLPHRSVKNISEWITMVVGTSLELDKAKIDAFNTNIKPFFTEDGFAGFLEFGKKTNIFSTIYYNEEMSLSSFLNKQPIMIESQAINGVYQWRFQVPLTINLIKGKIEEYKKGVDTKQEQWKFTLCIDVKRVNNNTEEGVLISRWSTDKCGVAKGSVNHSSSSN